MVSGTDETLGGSGVDGLPLVDANQKKEDLLGVAIRCGQDQPDEYGKLAGKM